jgi:signal transduction histidine kinase
MCSSFRARLLVFYALLVFTTLITFVFITSSVVRRLLYTTLDESLEAEMEWLHGVIAGYQQFGIPDKSLRDDIVTRSRMSPRKEFIEIYRPDGGEYVVSPNLGTNRLRPLLRGVIGEKAVTVSFRGAPLRLDAMRGPSGEIYVGYPIGDIEAAVDKIRASFFPLIPVALLLAVGGGAFLVAGALAPIRELNRRIDAVVSQPLDQEPERIATRSRDEIGELVEKVNDAVAKMRAGTRHALWFSTLASHELRTPLAILRNQMEGSLHRDTCTDTLRATIASAYDEVLRLGQLVEQFLHLSRIEAGTLQIDRRPVAMHALVEEFVSEVTPLAQDRGVSITSDSKEQTLVMGDAGALRQVLFNLLDNALKHTPVGGRLSVNTGRDEHQAIVAFSDTGAGIPSDRLERIFAFFYSGSVTTDGAQGAGLGLSLVRGIVEAHGGRIDVASTVGVGTTFTIVLPALTASNGGAAEILV